MTVLYVITAGERQYLMEVLKECLESNDDLESACSECMEILGSLEKKTQEEYDAEYASDRQPMEASSRIRG